MPQPNVTQMSSDERVITPIVEEAAPLVTRPVVRDGARQAAATPVAEGGLPLSYRHSDDFGELMVALAIAQGEFQAIEKNQRASVQSRREGARSYAYEYADLAAIMVSVRPSLSKNGIAMLQMPSVRRGAVIVTTMIVHGLSRQWFAVDLAVALDNLDPQAVGSATTYARRYGLTSLLGLAAFDRDDDGAAAQVKREDPPEVPAGFDAQWNDLTAVADEGFPALEAAWNAVKNGAFKTYVTRHRRDEWEALKVKALKVKRS